MVNTLELWRFDTFQYNFEYSRALNFWELFWSGLTLSCGSDCLALSDTWDYVIWLFLFFSRMNPPSRRSYGDQTVMRCRMRETRLFDYFYFCERILLLDACVRTRMSCAVGYVSGFYIITQYLCFLCIIILALVLFVNESSSARVRTRLSYAVGEVRFCLSNLHSHFSFFSILFVWMKRWQAPSSLYNNCQNPITALLQPNSTF